MEFSEVDKLWQPLPAWVQFLIRMGYEWPRDDQGPRRIALVSMPGDSAAAGLITLGALIRDLANPRANDTDGHYDRLLGYARQYVGSCRICDQRCNPESKRCGFAGEATGKLRSLRPPHAGYWVSAERTDFERREIAFVRGPVTYLPNPLRATDYYIDGEPPPRWDAPEGAMSAEVFSQIVPECQIHPDNLRRSYSGLCLAGRAGGEIATREICASVRLRDNSAEHGLDGLLTIHGWSAGNVSRAAFYNTRTGELDRNVAAPNLIVADGDVSFLDTVDRREFRNGDVVGVIHRIMERDRLEAVGNKMSALRQWYVPDEDMLCGLPAVPRGTSIAILKRRT